MRFPVVAISLTVSALAPLLMVTDAIGVGLSVCAIGSLLVSVETLFPSVEESVYALPAPETTSVSERILPWPSCVAPPSSVTFWPVAPMVAFAPLWVAAPVMVIVPSVAFALAVAAPDCVRAASILSATMVPVKDCTTSEALMPSAPVAVIVPAPSCVSFLSVLSAAWATIFSALIVPPDVESSRNVSVVALIVPASWSSEPRVMVCLGVPSSISPMIPSAEFWVTLPVTVMAFPLYVVSVPPFPDCSKSPSILAAATSPPPVCSILLAVMPVSVVIASMRASAPVCLIVWFAALTEYPTIVPPVCSISRVLEESVIVAEFPEL